MADVGERELFGDMDEDEVKPKVEAEPSPANGDADYSQEDLFGADEPDEAATDPAPTQAVKADEPSVEELFGAESGSGSDEDEEKGADRKKGKSHSKKIADTDEADDAAVASMVKEHEEESKKDTVILHAKGKPLQLLSSLPPRLPAQAQVVLARFPNIVSIDPTPFDPDTYEVMVPQATTNQHDAADERRRVQLGVENVIRWRVVTDEHGHKKRQSNARLVEWSDGSVQLLLGNEVMDAFQHKIDGHTNLMYSDFEDRKKNTDRKPNGSVAYSEAKQCFGPVSERIHFQNAAGATSKSHMKLRAILQEKHMHESKIKVTRAAAEIERRQEERERAEREFERTLDTQARKRRRNNDKAKAARGGDGKLSRDFLEAGADEEAEDDGSPRERQYRAEEEEEYSGGVSHERKVGRQAPKRRGGAEDDDESSKRLMKLKGDEGKDDENSSADEDFEEGSESEEESDSDSDEASESEEEEEGKKGKKAKGKGAKKEAEEEEEEEPQKKKQKAAAETKESDKPDDADEAAVNVKTGKKRRVIDDE